MQVNEIIGEKLSNDEMRFLINRLRGNIIEENVFNDIHELAVTYVVKPFSSFSKKMVDFFAAKLKTWALSTLHDLRKTTNFDEEKHYVKTLQKIINNPTGIAQQMINKIVADQLKLDVNKTPKNDLNKDSTNDEKLDDVLSSISL